MVESGRVPGNGRIPAIIKKVSRRGPEKGRMSVSTEKWKNPGEYREKVESVRVSKKWPDEYRKRVEWMWEPKNGGIQASIEKFSRRVPEMDRISVSIEKW